MPKINEQEQLAITALSRISQYQDPEELRENSETEWGLPYEEALEYAYENILFEARRTLDIIKQANQ